jgi:hypothetical protein
MEKENVSCKIILIKKTEKVNIKKDFGKWALVFLQLTSPSTFSHY